RIRRFRGAGPARAAESPWPARPAASSKPATRPPCHRRNEVAPEIGAVERLGFSPALTVRRLSDFVGHQHINFQFAFELSFSQSLSNRAGEGETLQVLQFLFVTDSGSRLFESLVG